MVTACRSGTRSRTPHIHAADWCDATPEGPAARQAANRSCSGVRGDPPNRITPGAASSHSPVANRCRSWAAVTPKARDSRRVTKPCWSRNRARSSLASTCFIDFQAITYCPLGAFRRSRRRIGPKTCVCAPRREKCTETATAAAPPPAAPAGPPAPPTPGPAAPAGPPAPPAPTAGPAYGRAAAATKTATSSTDPVPSTTRQRTGSAAASVA